MARTPVLPPKATPVGALSAHLRRTWPQSSLVCPQYVDSRHRVGISKILGGGRIALMAARAHEADVRFATCVLLDRIQGWPS